MDNVVCAVIIILILIILFQLGFLDSINKFDVKSKYDGQYYSVHRTHENPQQAADILSKLNEHGIRVLEHMRQKYLIHGEKNGATASQIDFVKRALKNYDFEAIVENSPFNLAGETSYTVDKGQELHICLRDKAKDADFHDFDVLLFVFYHELSHIGNWDYGHKLNFWMAFKFLLQNAVEIGDYVPYDYGARPVYYCNGLEINHQPLYDASIPDM